MGLELTRHCQGARGIWRRTGRDAADDFYVSVVADAVGEVCVALPFNVVVDRGDLVIIGQNKLREVLRVDWSGCTRGGGMEPVFGRKLHHGGSRREVNQWRLSEWFADAAFVQLSAGVSRVEPEGGGGGDEHHGEHVQDAVLTRIPGVNMDTAQEYAEWVTTLQHGVLMVAVDGMQPELLERLGQLVWALASGRFEGI